MGVPFLLRKIMFSYSHKRTLKNKEASHRGTEDTEFFNWFNFLFLCVLCVSAANILIFKMSALGQKHSLTSYTQHPSINQLEQLVIEYRFC